MTEPPRPMSDSVPPIFFVHLMKTGGTTLKRMIKAGMDDAELYPNRADEEQRFRAHMDIEYLLGISPERAAQTRFYSGHFPYVATELIGRPVHTITLLREPVERVISHLKQSREGRSWFPWSPKLVNKDDPTLEEIYDDEVLGPRFFRNHQVRMFAMTRDRYASSLFDTFPLGESSLDQACRNLEKVDTVGVLDRFEDFVQQVTDRCGIKARKREPQNVSIDRDPVPAELKARIAEDNRLDIEFYNYAKNLCERRGRVPA